MQDIHTDSIRKDTKTFTSQVVGLSHNKLLQHKIDGNKARPYLGTALGGADFVCEDAMKIPTFLCEYIDVFVKHNNTYVFICVCNVCVGASRMTSLNQIDFIEANQDSQK